MKSGTTLSIPSGTKPQLSTLLTSCWNRSPTKRPTAAEIAELLYNNPRLVSPCIDVPLASVQVMFFLMLTLMLILMMELILMLIIILIMILTLNSILMLMLILILYMMLV